jgi:predicted transglutaminase-like cysteine proteinase
MVFITQLTYAHQHLLPKEQLKKINTRYDAQTSRRFNAWDRLMLDSQGKTALDKLRLVNDFFNRMAWVEDRNLWKQRDYWATPIETLLKNAGDCEDFSIAKYFTLRALNVPLEKLKISYVKIIKDNQPHMVLAYFPAPGSDPLILDNMNKQILKRSKRSDLLPMFSFNTEGLWLASNHSPEPVSDSSKIKRWADLIKRMKSENI